MPHHEVRNLVLSVNDEKMTEQILQQLVKYLPGKEEVRIHDSYIHEKTYLVGPDKLYRRSLDSAVSSLLALISREYA